MVYVILSYYWVFNYNKRTLQGVPESQKIKISCLPDRQASKITPFAYLAGRQVKIVCFRSGLNISELVLKNEKDWRTEKEIYGQLRKIVDAMKKSVYKVCHSPGILPGGLNVKRRAS
ncbi:MAG: hypothetical protein ACC651_16895, partial [Candidatus Scalindua sp.]